MELGTNTEFGFKTKKRDRPLQMSLCVLVISFDSHSCLTFFGQCAAKHPHLCS